jgi:hypothetical protein
VNGLEQWRKRWQAAGVQVIPLKHSSKEPMFAWQTVTPAEQWQRLGSGFRGNIGAVLGNGFAVIDCDNTQALSSVSAFCDGNGLKLPQVQTVSGGAHYWLTVSDAPADFSYQLLAPEVGAGELRVSRCYVAAPCSSIGDKRYKFVYGSPESLAGLRAVRWQTLLALVSKPAPEREFERLPVRLVRRDMPARASDLLLLLRDAPESIPVDRYQSRSEAEAAVVAVLILAGWTKPEIRKAFEDARAAHYLSAGNSRGRYFETTYRNVLNDICNTPERVELAAMYQAAEGLSWGGACGALNMATYRALCAVAWQFATFEPEASERVLAEHAAATQRGISNALKRLERLALVDVIGSARSPYHATKYRLDSRNVLNSHSINALEGGAQEQTEQVQSDKAQATITARKERVCDALSWQGAEVFGVAALGRSAELVLRWLSDTPQTINGLAKLTGKNWHTVKQALERLAKNELAKETGSGWQRGHALLGLVATDFEARERALRRRSQHEREREAWRELAEDGTK